jgi:hypothetical protein
MASVVALALLPALLSPGPPFPHVLSDAVTTQTIAPGVDYGEYDLLTSDGPIVVRVVAVAPHRGDVTIGTVLARDALSSNGETVSSMARRTGAVAGINADYFDIGNTNAPTNVVVRNGELLRTPRKRYALVVGKDGTPQFVEETFTGDVQIGDRDVPLAAVNEMPPPGAAISLITPEFGPVPPAENVTLVALSLVFGARPPFGSYRVFSIADNLTRQAPGYYLAIGVNAYDAAGVPNAGDAIVARGDLSPAPLASLVAAAGGGPLILYAGAPFVDPDGPNGGEYAARIPASGAAIAADGTLFLLQVDGRQPDESIGVTRPEFAAVMRALGATDGVAFDGGGSSELAVRAIGTRDPALANSPSDGLERPVADGVFVYSTAPLGPPSQLVASPAAVHALVGAAVSLKTAAIDAAEHVVDAPSNVTSARVDPASLGTYDNGEFTATAAGDGALFFRNGTLTARVPIHVRADPARVAIVPEHPTAPTGGRVVLHARAFDEQGNALALPAELSWRTTGGRIDSGGALTVGSSNTLVSLLVGDHLASVNVVVGSHDVPLDLINGARFMTVPANGEGSIVSSDGCAGCLSLHFSLAPAERAAYAVVERPLPALCTALRFELLDDGSGARVKVALRNAINEEVLLNAVTLDHPGWRAIEVPFPSTLAQPARLVGLYVIAAHPGAPVTGTVTFRNLHAIAAGSR